jgi:hypothetical protein
MPPDLSHCEISIAGYTGRDSERGEVFIREIKSISGLKAPDLDVVYFSHPDDHIFLERQLNKGDSSDAQKQSETRLDIKKLDPESKPNASRKGLILKLGSSSLNFDVEPNTRRRPRDVRALAPNVETKADEPTPEEVASLRQGSDSGTVIHADIENLDSTVLIEAPKKLLLFQEMLNILGEQYNWKISNQVGDVPKKRCRSQHLVDGRPRRYCHVVITRDETTIIQALEIELTTKLKKDGNEEYESLSTLFFRASDTTETFRNILDDLMSASEDKSLGAMSWKRESISKYTSVREYLGHPDSKVQSEQDALASWVARAAEKVLGM